MKYLYYVYKIYSSYQINIIEIKMNIIINGKSTKNQAIPVAPARHIRLRIQVQNKTYTSLIIKIITVLETAQLYDPMQ